MVRSTQKDEYALLLLFGGWFSHFSNIKLSHKLSVHCKTGLVYVLQKTTNELVHKRADPRISTKGSGRCFSIIQGGLLSELKSGKVKENISQHQLNAIASLRMIKDHKLSRPPIMFPFIKQNGERIVLKELAKNGMENAPNCDVDHLVNNTCDDMFSCAPTWHALNISLHFIRSEVGQWGWVLADVEYTQADAPTKCRKEIMAIRQDLEA